MHKEVQFNRLFNNQLFLFCLFRFKIWNRKVKILFYAKK